MIVFENLPRLREVAAAKERVLDVGGWFRPFNLATHVIDAGEFATRRVHETLDPEDPLRYSVESWTQHDVCVTPWPFPDQYFDFAICSHLLEDVRDPLTVCRELQRVAKAGYIETPSRLREIFSKKRFFRLKSLFGNIPEVGFRHHRWFVELEGTHLSFTEKVAGLLEHRSYYLTRAQVGRTLTVAESAVELWWEGGFTAEERFIDPREDYPLFRRQAFAALRRG
jgi:hypothetical protein